MKTKSLLIALSFLMVFGNSHLWAESEPVMIYLVDPNDPSPEKAELEPADVSDTEEPQVEQPRASTPTKAQEAQKKLDDLIAKIQNEDSKLTDRNKRIAEIVRKEQKEFLRLMDEFLTTPFNPRDDDAYPEFSKIRDRIVDLTFDAATQRDFYELIYLTNDAYRKNPEKADRFESLDDHLYDRNIKMEERQKQIRLVIAGGASLIGLGLGGYLSYKASQKVIPIVANEGGFSSVAKLLGRGTMIIVGAGVGATAAGYLGFLGSDLLFKHEREFINPIQKDQDLKEILEYIDGLNTKSLPL